MRNRQLPTVISNLLKKRLLLFALLLLISGAMFGQRPTVNTTAVTNITETSAVCGGRVVSEGGAPVDERGIYFNTTPNVGVGNMVIADSGGVGFFTINLTGLMPGTTYYVRAFAINAEGTSYGATLSFTTLAPCTITASANPSSGGSVSGNGTYNHGTTCTLTATPNTGYHFVNWTENGSPVSTNAQYSFTVTGNRTLVANFSNTYTITASANPSSGGSVSGNGTYDYGASCTLTANPNTGYHFVNWTENGQVVQNAGASYTFTVEGNRTLVANFAINTYTITASANPSSGGSVTQSGTGTYNHGTTCTLTATPNTGYHFVNWTEGGNPVSTNAQYSFTVTGPRTLVANFEINSYLITAAANPTTGGTVSGGGTYNHGASCTLNASQSTGYTFINWTKNGSEVSNSPSYTFTVVEAGDYVANFTINQYTVTAQADPPAGGTVTGSGGFNHGEICTLVATANTGYTFVNWTKNGAQVSTTPTYSFTVTESASYVAHFLINSYEITVTANPSNGGTVSGGGTYTYGSTITLTATNEYGYHFDHWQDGITDNPRTDTVTQNATYTAYFIKNQYTITTRVEPDEAWGDVTGGGTYDYQSNILLIANPNPGYSFQKWDDEITQNPRQITVTGNATYKAIFTRDMYIITTEVTPEGAGTVTGGGSFYYGDNTTLTANANSGYTFQGWTDGDTANPRTVTVSQDTTYTAVFGEVGVTYYNVTASVNPNGAGTVTGTGPFPAGSTTTLTANAYTGYTFNHWNDNTTQNPRTDTVNSNLSFTAYFTQNTYTITTNVSPAGAGTVTGGGSYHYGDQTTLQAFANEGYEFDHWSDSITSNPRQITVTGNATYTAYFNVLAPNVYTISTEVSPAGAGTVEGGGTYLEGETATLVATPNPGYTFDRWNDNVTDNPRDITVTGDATYTAAFTPILYTIHVVANPEEGGHVEVDGGGQYGQYMFGDTCTVSATANPGFFFIDWKDEDGLYLSDNLVYSFVVTGNFTLTANFAGEGQHVIFVEIDPEEGGTATGAGAYDDGEECTLKAFAKLGYSFVNWTKGDDVASEVPTFSFTVTESAHYVAHFEKKKYTITASASPEEGGTVSGGGIYLHGVTCTLTAEPNAYYEFLHWKNNDGVIVSEEREYTFQVTADASFTAYFETNESYTISVSSNNSEWGTVEGGGTFNDGDICRLIAVPKEGYVFANWTEDGEVVPNAGPAYEFTVHRSRNLVANFTPDQYYIISAMASGNGSITPQGDIMVAVGGTQSFTMMPNEGCRIIKVLVDGLDVGPVESYTFTNVNRDHTIYAAFSGTGVEEAQSLDISVYPNPAKNKVYVEGDGIETMVLFDMFGNRMLNVDYNTSKELNVSGLPKGQYILVLTTRDGLVGYEKLVLH